MAKLHEGWLAQQVTAEQHSVPDFLRVKLAGQISPLKPSTGFDTNLEAKPGTIGAASRVVPGKALLGFPADGMGGQCELQHILQWSQPTP